MEFDDKLREFGEEFRELNEESREFDDEIRESEYYLASPVTRSIAKRIEEVRGICQNGQVDDIDNDVAFAIFLCRPIDYASSGTGRYIHESYHLFHLSTVH